MNSFSMVENIRLKKSPIYKKKKIHPKWLYTDFDMILIIRFLFSSVHQKKHFPPLCHYFHKFGLLWVKLRDKKKYVSVTVQYLNAFLFSNLCLVFHFMIDCFRFGFFFKIDTVYISIYLLIYLSFLILICILWKSLWYFKLKQKKFICFLFKSKQKKM